MSEEHWGELAGGTGAEVGASGGAIGRGVPASGAGGDHSADDRPADDGAQREPSLDAGGPPRAQDETSAPADRHPSAAGTISDEQVKMALRKVKDPELNLNIVDLGLIYGVTVEENDIDVAMTLTSPGCPSGPQIMGDVERVLQALPGAGAVTVNLVWSPFWTPDRIEPRVRAYLGL